MFQQHEQNLEGLLLQTDAALALAQLSGLQVELEVAETNCLLGWRTGH